MIKCINLSHPEFVQLQETMDQDPLSLAWEVGAWQEAQGVEDTIPTAEELQNFANEPKETTLQYPLVTKRNLNAFRKTVNKANLPEVVKEGINYMLDYDHTEVYLKTEEKDFKKTWDELSKIIPVDYLEDAGVTNINGDDIHEIAVLHPTVVLQTPEDLEELQQKAQDRMLTDGEIFEKFSTFFSDNQDRRGKVDRELEAFLVKLLEDYGIRVEQKDIENELDTKVAQGILKPDYRNKVWAFAEVLSSGGYKGSIHLKPNGYTTEDLYEEAGHIFTYWLQKYNIQVDGIDYKLWEKPVGTVDYLAMTPEYKARYADISRHYAYRIQEEITNINNLRSERLDPDISDQRFTFLNNFLQDPANIKLANMTVDEQLTLADKLARIEITGQLVGGGLEASAREEVYKNKAVSTGVASFINNWVGKVVDWFKQLRQRLFGNVKDLGNLRNIVQSEDFLKEEIPTGNQQGFQSYLQAIQNFSDSVIDGTLKPELEVTKDLSFVEIISRDKKEDVHAFLQEVSPILQQQITDIEKEIAKLTSSDFLNNYSLYLDSVGQEGLQQGVDKLIWISLRSISPKDSAFILKNTNSALFEGLQDTGEIDGLQKYFEKDETTGGTVWDLYKQAVYNINVDTRIDLKGTPEMEMVKEIKNRIVQFNQKLEAGLETNIKEGIRPAPDTPSLYERWHERYNDYKDRLKDFEGLQLKLNTVNSYIANEQISKAMELFLLGKEIPLKDGTTYKVPALFDDLKLTLDTIENKIGPRLKTALENFDLSKQELENATIAYNKTGNDTSSLEYTTYLDKQAEFEKAKVLVKLARPDRFHYSLMHMKWQYFSKVLDKLGGQDFKLRNEVLTYFKEKDRGRVETAIENAKDRLNLLNTFLSNLDKDFLKDCLEAYDKSSKGDNLKLNLPVNTDELIRDIGSYEALFGAKMNHDRNWAHVVFHIKSLSDRSIINTTDKVVGLNQILEQEQEALENNPVVQNVLQNTKTKKIQELFHERVNGERTHYMISEYKHDELARQQNEYMQGVYNILNEHLENTGSNIRIPLGDSEHEQSVRNRILGWGQDPELIWEQPLQELRKLYRVHRTAFKLTFNESKSEAEIDAIKEEKRRTLLPHQYRDWLKKNEQWVPMYLTDTKATWVKVHDGELAVPATRPSDVPVNLAMRNGDFWESFPTTLAAVNFKNEEFENLYNVPGFKRMYDYMFQMQKETYDKMMRERPTQYSRLRLYQSGAFEGEQVDVWRRTLNLKLKEAAHKVWDLIKSMFEVNDEEKFVLSKDNVKVPMRGIVAYDDPNRLADSYFTLLTKYWHSMENYDIKTKGLQELETLRAVLKNRKVENLIQKRPTIWQRTFGKYKRDVDATVSGYSDTWAKFIDDTYENLLYEEHTKFGDNVKNKPGALGGLMFLAKLPAIGVFLRVGAQVPSATAAHIQSTVGLVNAWRSGRYFTSSTSDNAIEALRESITEFAKLWYEDRVNATTEYITNHNFTKLSLVQEYFGVTERDRNTQNYASFQSKFMSDAWGYGLMRMANFRPFRVITRKALGDFRWVEEARMFMNPEQYHRWRSQDNPYLKIKESRKDFKAIPENMWDMLEIQDGKIVPNAAHETKFTPEIRGMVHQYLKELYGELDMSITDQPAALRSLWGKFFFSLKKWLLRWQNQVIQDRYNVSTGTYDRSYLKYFQMTLQSLTDPEAKRNLASLRQTDYDARDAVGRLSTMFLTEVVSGAVAALFTGFAIKFCDKKRYEPLPCWVAAQTAYYAKRTMAEVGGMFSVPQLLTNFDKPLGAWGAFSDFFAWVGAFSGLPIDYILNLISGDPPEMVERGPYKGMSKSTAGAIKAVPLARGLFEFFNNAAIISRDQLITAQLNQKSHFPIILTGIPDAYRYGLGWLPNTIIEKGFNDPKMQVNWPSDIIPKIRTSTDKKAK